MQKNVVAKPSLNKWYLLILDQNTLPEAAIESNEILRGNDTELLELLLR